MKFTIITLVIALSLIHSIESYYYGYGYTYGRYGSYGAYGGYSRYGGYGRYHYGKRNIHHDHEEFKNITECIYSKENMMLYCQGPSGVKECTVELKWDKPLNFQSFGLALPVESSGVLTDMKYRLFPRKLDNTEWIVYSDKDVSLYHSDKYNDNGFLVKDKTCFADLVSILNSSTRKELVLLNKQSVTIIGDLIVAEKEPKHLYDELDSREYMISKNEDKLVLLEKEKVKINKELEKEIIKSEIKREMMHESMQMLNDEIKHVKKSLTDSVVNY